MPSSADRRRSAGSPAAGDFTARTRADRQHDHAGGALDPDEVLDQREAPREGRLAARVLRGVRDLLRRGPRGRDRAAVVMSAGVSRTARASGSSWSPSPVSSTRTPGRSASSSRWRASSAPVPGRSGRSAPLRATRAAPEAAGRKEREEGKTGNGEGWACGPP